MNKTGLIIKREYVTRVRKRSFIIMSILGPLLFALIWIIPIWLATREGDEKIIKVLDESGLFQEKLDDEGSIKFEYISSNLDNAKSDIRQSGYYGLLYIPDIDIDEPDGIIFFAESNPSIEVIGTLERKLKFEIEDIKLKRSELDKETIDGLKARVNIKSINMTDSGEKAGSAGVATIVGYVSALLIYFFIFFYGIMILRGVIEEKTNRIIEVIVSSVKPIQLMMGKIIGVGAVGLTQFLIWVFFTALITNGLGAYFGVSRYADPSKTEIVESKEDISEEDEFLTEILSSIESIDIPKLLIAFLIYFLGAYLLYGALFAAVGSAVDNDTDAQQFQLPITIPLIFSIVVLGAILKDPHGSLAFWLSMIPLTSPVIMMMRMPFGVPTWELMLSIAFLALGFLFATWLAARIYRIGILIHGTKVNYRTLWKWLWLKY
ncbi:ABC transporter permease [Bacteroidota bacterium]